MYVLSEIEVEMCQLYKANFLFVYYFRADGKFLGLFLCDFCELLKFEDNENVWGWEVGHVAVKFA